MENELLELKICPWCGNYHAMICPKIKAMEYWESGLLKRVEFFPPYVPNHEHGPE